MASWWQTMASSCYLFSVYAAKTLCVHMCATPLVLYTVLRVATMNFNSLFGQLYSIVC